MVKLVLSKRRVVQKHIGTSKLYLPDTPSSRFRPNGVKMPEGSMRQNPPPTAASLVLGSLASRPARHKGRRNTLGK